MKRKDIHRPSVIDPADYDYLFSFTYPGLDGDPGYNTALLVATKTGKPAPEPVYAVDERTGRVVVVGYRDVVSPWGKLPYFDKGEEASGGCDICGAHFRHGDIWRHRSSGEAIRIGHQCADKMGLVSGRGEWTRRMRELAALRKSAEYIRRKLERQEKVRAEAVEFLREHPGLDEALRLEHRISRDLSAKLDTYGKLSARQVELAFKLAREAAEPKPDEKPEILPPAGRAVVEGVVLKTRDIEEDFGVTVKMTVLVETEAGRFRLFGTVPAALLRDRRRREIDLTRCRVRFSATISPKESGFGYFNRPSAATIVEVPAEATAAA